MFLSNLDGGNVLFSSLFDDPLQGSDMHRRIITAFLEFPNHALLWLTLSSVKG